MKKRILITICILASFLLGCGPPQNYSNQRANDVISKAIYKELGGEQIYYQGKEAWEDNVICYQYILHEEEPDQLERMLEAVNTAIQQEGIEDKISIKGWGRIAGNGLETLFVLQNYSDTKNEQADYKTMKKLVIVGARVQQGSMYNDPATYKDLPGIVDLEVDWEMAEKTEREGIDWYEYFPELEKLEVDLPDGK